MYPRALSSPNFIQRQSNNKGQVSMVEPDVKAKAEVYYGDETCREKFTWLLTQTGLPNGLLKLEEIEECGYVKDTGFVWLKHKKQRDYHKFENVVICFDTIVTAYFEHNKIKNLTGVKAKEFWIWITLSEIYVKDYNSCAASITFKTSSGLSKSFPLSVFKIEAFVSQGQVKEIDEVKEYDQTARNAGLSLCSIPKNGEKNFAKIADDYGCTKS